MQSGMANSIKPAGSQPAGSFRHAASGAEFRIFDRDGVPWQSEDTASFSTAAPMSYAVGSGSHAIGYILQRGDHLFQSPLSYYVSRKTWDMAPGYETSTAPDFARPVTAECVSCHADKPRPVRDSLNTYLTPAFEGAGIQCDRCHGSAEQHLKHPVPGSIVNPGKLSHAARDSVCEQCHLTGEIRIPNPGKQITDFQPAQTLEDVYTVYVSRNTGPAASVKVVSQAEQLTLSKCVRASAGELWCGSCHNAHEPLQQSAAYYRDKCLSCHGQTLAKSHAGSSQDCVGCHMPRLPAKDGGHTAFTDHRISRPAAEPSGSQEPGSTQLTAWREPQSSLAGRNLALALVTTGMQEHDSAAVIRGYRMLNRSEKEFPSDPALLTALGTILLTAKQPAEAKSCFERALAARPQYAPYEVNLAGALMDMGDGTGGTRHLERAVELDPLLAQAVELLRQAYQAQGDQAKADELMNRYHRQMAITEKESH